LKKLKPAARRFRGELPPGYPDPDELELPKIKSILEEYRVLAIVFGILGLALAAYFIKSVMRAPPPAPSPVQSVYIEAVPSSPPAKQP
jgi:hypothetical protein